MMNDNTGTLANPGRYDVIGVLCSPWDPEKYVPVSVQIEIMAEPYCGDPNHPYPLGDLNCDCYVNLLDLEIIASHWLEYTGPEREVEVTDVKIIKGELVGGRFHEIEEVDKLIVEDVFLIRIKVSNLGSKTTNVFNLYGWDLSPQNHVEVIGNSVPCAAIFKLKQGESAYLYPFCLSQAFKAEQDGWVTMDIYVKDWVNDNLCEYTFTFEILASE
jgi:hypothetical protein